MTTASDPTRTFGAQQVVWAGRVEPVTPSGQNVGVMPTFCPLEGYCAARSSGQSLVVMRRPARSVGAARAGKSEPQPV